MPFGIKRVTNAKGEKKYKVVNKVTGKTYSKEPMTKAKAEKQRIAININLNSKDD